MCLLMLYPLFLQSVMSQSFTVNARIDSTMMWIGQQTQLTFEITQAKGKHIQTPVFSDSIPGGLELVEKVKTDTVQSQDGQIIVNQRYIVTAFEDSLLFIPPFPFVHEKDTVWSKSLSLKVIQPFAIDTASNALADIKNVFNPKFDWKGFFLKILFGLLLLLLAFLVFVLIRRIIQKKPVFEIKKAEPELPAHVIAIAELDKIKQDKPWQRNRDKEYHTALTDILRVYIEKVFGVTAMEMTSDEILEHLRFLNFEKKDAYLHLRQILALADLVKFARWKAAPDEHEMSLTNAYLFVNETKKEEVINVEIQPSVERT